ncbi:MAG TPA: MFS transporter [Acidimicrobiales bacterium]
MPAGAGLRRRFVLLTALRWLPVGFVTPVAVLLPLSRNLTLEQVGLVMACYAATTALLELPTGGVADAVGRRPVLVASSAVGIVVFALMLVADGLAPWIAVKVLAGAARALDSGPLEAWYVDEARRLDPAADIRRGLSRAHAAEAGGLGLSAAAGGVLPVAFGGSLAAAVVAAGAAQALHLVGVLALVTEHRSPDPRALRRAARQVPAVVGGGLAVATGRGPVSWLLCGSVVWGLALGGVELLWQPRFTDLLGGRSDTGPLGVLMAAAFLAAAVGSALAQRLARLVGGSAGRSAMVCTLTQAAACVGLAAAGSFALAAPAFVVVYLLNGARAPFHHELLHDHVAASQRSTMLSAASLSLMAGGLVGSLTLPALAGAAGIPWTWALVGAVLAASALLYRSVPDRPAPIDAPAIGAGVTGAS